MSKKIDWNEDRLNILRSMYPTEPANDIAVLIGCSDSTVINKAKKLGLKRDPSFSSHNFIGRYTKNRGKYNIYDT